MHLSKYAFSFLLSVLPLLLSAQHIPFKLYTPHDGLSQSQVNSIFQDSRGYIWLATHYGVSCFNGETFKNITPKDGIPFSSVRHIQEDSKGNICFMASKYFCKYDGKKVQYDTMNVTAVRGLFFFDKSYTAWLINDSDDYIYKSKDCKQWECVSKTDSVLANIQWNVIGGYDAKYDRHILYLGPGEVPYSYTNGKLKRLFYMNLQMTQQANGVIYGANNDSLFIVQKDTSVFLKKIKLNKGAIVIVARDNNKFHFTKWLGNSLYTLNADNSIDSLPLNISGTNRLFEDKDKNMWIATEEGLIRVFPEGFTNYDKKQLGAVWSMVEDAKGDMWFGSHFDPTKIKHLKDGIITTTIATKNTFPQIKDIPSDVFGHFYFGGERDNEGSIYFPTGNGIIKHDGKKYTRMGLDTSISYDHPDGVSRIVSMNFYLDKDKNTIVSGTGHGVNIISLKDNRIKYYGKEKGLHKTGYVLGITKDKQARYWLSTGKGVAILDMQKDSIIKNYTRELNNFPYFGSICIFCDAKGTIWAGCSQGLLRYNPQSDTFVLVAKDIINSGIAALATYKDRYLIVTAKNGVYLLDLEAFYKEDGKEVIRCFNQHNGYLGIEPNQNCLYMDSKDNAWIAASDIVTKLSISEMDMTTKPLVPYILSINDAAIPYEKYGQVVDVAYSMSTAKIAFEAVGFDRPFVTEYAYQLNDGAWSNWQTERFALFNNLASGVYTFRVRARPSATVAEKHIKETNIQFRIDLPFYKEPNFSSWLVGGISLLTMLFGYSFMSNRQKEKEKKLQHELELAQEKQEKIDQERAYQAYKMQQEQEKIDQERKIKYLQIQTLQAQLNPHFIFNILQGVKNRISQGSKEQATKLVIDLAKLIRSFLDASVSMNVAKIQNAVISLEEEIKLLTSYINFEHLQYSDRFDYEITVSDDIYPETVQLPPMLIQPYIENAIKHGILYETGRKCHLHITFHKTENDILVCRIIDDGVGREKAKALQATFIKIYESHSTQLLADRIKIMQELGEGIYITIKDNVPSGTIVEIGIDM